MGNVADIGIELAKIAIERRYGEDPPCCNVSRSRPSRGCDLEKGDQAYEVKSTVGEDLTGFGGRWLERSEWERLCEYPDRYSVVEVSRINEERPWVRVISGRVLLRRLAHLPWDELRELVETYGEVSIHVTPPWQDMEGDWEDITPEWDPSELEQARDC